MSTADEQPPCRACGRPISPRRSHRGKAVVYCSDACRSRRLRPIDRRIEARILGLLDSRAPGSTICPSEVAREVRPADWREWMECVRRAGRRLAARGEVTFTQGGCIVDPGTARGPIRIRRP
ncbi:MAG: DUF3253 domain-containing protein [Planctomycetota bacterium]